MVSLRLDRTPLEEKPELGHGLRRQGLPQSRGRLCGTHHSVDDLDLEPQLGQDIVHCRPPLAALAPVVARFPNGP